MLRLAVVFMTLLVFMGAASAASPIDDLCPFFDPDKPQELVSTENGVTIQGVCTGSMSVRSMSTYQGGGTISSNNFALSASHGDTAFAFASDVAGIGTASNTGTTKLFQFTGNGASMEDSFYMSRLGPDTCEDVTGSTSAILTSGGFASSLTANAAPEIGTGLEYEFTTDLPDGPAGIAGVFRTQYRTNQIYGTVDTINQTVTRDYSSDVSIRSRWVGLSTVSGGYSFLSLVVEE